MNLFLACQYANYGVPISYHMQFTEIQTFRYSSLTLQARDTRFLRHLFVYMQNDMLPRPIRTLHLCMFELWSLIFFLDRQFSPLNMKFHNHLWTNVLNAASSHSYLYLWCTDWEKEADGQVRHLDLMQVREGCWVYSWQDDCGLLTLYLANWIKEFTSWKKKKPL